MKWKLSRYGPNKTREKQIMSQDMSEFHFSADLIKDKLVGDPVCVPLYILQWFVINLYLCLVLSCLCFNLQVYINRWSHWQQLHLIRVWFAVFYSSSDFNHNFYKSDILTLMMMRKPTTEILVTITINIDRKNCFTTINYNHNCDQNRIFSHLSTSIS